MKKRLIVILGNRGVVFPAFPFWQTFQYGGDDDFAFIVDIADPETYR